MALRRVFLPASVVIVAVFFGTSPAGRPAEPQAPAPASRPEVQPPNDPLGALNEASRAAYRRAKEAALAGSGPVILVEGDNLVLRRGDRREEVRFTPAAYHDLKAIAHIPLALDVMLSGAPDDGRLGAATLDELTRYRPLIEAARARARTLELPEESARRQEEIVAGCLEFLDAVVRDGTCRPAERVAFARRMTPRLMANVADAARAELGGLDRVVGRWKDGLPPEEWNRLTVIVMGRPLPRKDSLAVQFFARRLGETGEGPRVVFAESVFDESKALDLLATRLVDAMLGRDFFDDPTRMYRDLLGDAARAHLDQPERPPGPGR